MGILAPKPKAVSGMQVQTEIRWFSGASFGVPFIVYLWSNGGHRGQAQTEASARQAIAAAAEKDPEAAFAKLSALSRGPA